MPMALNRPRRAGPDRHVLTGAGPREQVLARALLALLGRGRRVHHRRRCSSSRQGGAAGR
jgi:hypothetical protein